MKRIILFIGTMLFCVTSAFGNSCPNDNGGGGGSPGYFGFNDLIAAADNYRSDFYYEWWYQFPSMATLPYQAADGSPWRAVKARDANNKMWKRLRTAKPLKPGRYLANWQEYLTFPWDDPCIMDGDIVFIRGGDEVSRVICCFSTWTHTAMMYNKWKNQSFESQKTNGVAIYDYRKAWTKIKAYSVKRVNNCYNPSTYLEKSLNAYGGRPYFPSLIEASKGPHYFFLVWGDKKEMGSMYCAKLVWHTFNDFAGIDLDSELTSSNIFGKSARRESGSTNDRAWIGVSPDDIYGSRKLSWDIVMDGQENLREPLVGTAF